MIKTAKKYILACPKNKQKQIFELLNKQQNIEVIGESENSEKTEIEKQDISDRIEKIDYFISSLEFVIAYLSPFAKKQSFLDKIKGIKIQINKDYVFSEAKKREIDFLMQRIVKIEKRISLLKNNIKENNKKIERLKIFGNLDFVPQDTGFSFMLLARTQTARLDFLIKEISVKKVYIKELSIVGGKTSFLIIGEKQKKQDIINIIKKNKAEVLEYEFDFSAKQEKASALEQIKENEKEIENLFAETKNKAKQLKELKIAYDFACIEKTNLEIEASALKKEIFSYIAFWAMPKDKNDFEKKAKNIDRQIYITKYSLSKDELAPVILENKKSIMPFEYVTEIFGLPRGDEIDPTPYLAFFFILFFGICITDAGYGIILSVLTGLAMLFLKDLRKNKLVKLLFYGGISTFLVGVLFNSYFGATAGSLGIPFVGRMQIIDPIKDTVLFMGATFALGYLQLFMAQIIKIISGRRNNRKQMLFSGTAWFFAYLFGALLMLSIKFPYLKIFGLIGIVFAGIGVMLAESMGTKIFLKPLVGGIQALQGVINTMSDILSYSRLMALGLATAVIALIVNQIAGIFSGIIPIVGWLVGGLILIGGHLFNLSINALSGFIHSGRLQFVEFFPKFLEGGGRRFKPTSSQFKYIKVIE